MEKSHTEEADDRDREQVDLDSHPSSRALGYPNRRPEDEAFRGGLPLGLGRTRRDA